MKTSDVVLVLGMHRSGTSSVAGVLSKLGGGTPRQVMAANHTNVRGFFESVPFMHLNNEMLASAGTQWKDWRLVNPDWRGSPAAAEFRRRAKELFAQEFEGSALPVLKDPRMCRILPFWLDVLGEMGATPHLVIPTRSPLDVAQSLRTIHGSSLTHGLLLWLRHVVDAEWHSRGMPRSIFTWRDFLADWRGVCGKIASDTHLTWPRLSDRAARKVDAFLTNDLVHSDTDDAKLAAHGDVHEWVLGAHEALLELARDPQSSSALTALDDVRGLLDQASRIFGRLLTDTEIALEETRRHARAVEAERDALRLRGTEVLPAGSSSRHDAAAGNGAHEKPRDPGASPELDDLAALSALRSRFQEVLKQPL